MLRVVPDDKRTKIGPTAPVRPVTAKAVAAVAPNPTPAPLAATAPGTPPGTPPPTTDPPGGAATSYLPPATDPLLGQVLAGRYLLHKKLGEGGMGAVYLATHNVLEKQVALKVLHGEFARKPDLVERFMQEAKAASRIRHENVIDISDFGATPDGMVFFAMELLKGRDLHEEIARARLAGQLLPWERSKRIFLQICAALTAAHALGIVHRDLKPENIFLVDYLGEPDFVKLLDFGIAKLTETADGDRKLTRTGMLFGTPEYMSPEQARGEPVDHRVDIYAMGCILFQLVTGRVPFEAENFMGVLSLHLTEPPPVIPAEVFDTIGAPRALAGVIDQALAKDRNQRFATIDDFARAVRRASGDKVTAPVTAQVNVAAPSATANRVKTQWTGNLSVPEHAAESPPASKSKLPLILGAVLVLGGAGAAAFFATRGDAAPVTASGSAAPGSAGSGAISAGSAGATATPATAQPPALPALDFEWSIIRIDARPQADVTDLAIGKVIGHTPFTVKVRPSRTARQFELHARNYVNTVVEIVPDREHIEHLEKLEKGAGKKVVQPTGKPEVKPDDGPVLKVDPNHAAPQPDVPAIKPDVPAVKPDVPAVKPEPTAQKPEVPKPPARPVDDDCGDPPCLKHDPSRPPGGSAAPP